MEQTSSPQSGGGFLNGVLRVLPVIQWVLMIAGFIGGYALLTRDSLTTQGMELNRIVNEQKALRQLVDERKSDRDKQIESLSGKMLSKEVFEAYMQAIRAEQERQSKMLEQILQNNSQSYSR